MFTVWICIECLHSLEEQVALNKTTVEDNRGECQRKKNVCVKKKGVNSKTFSVTCAMTGGYLSCIYFLILLVFISVHFHHAVM